MRVRCWPSWFQRRSGGPSVASFRFTDDDRVHTCLSSDIVNPIDEPACGVQFPTRSAMRTHPPAGRLAAGVDDLWPEPFGKPRSRDLAVMGGKAEPATALKSAAERRSSPAPPRRQFDHVTSFLKGRATPVPSVRPQ